jgi:hypothetical protein
MDKAIWQQEHLLWDIAKVKSVIADHSNAVSFFCGGSRNFSKFIDLFDGVFVLDVDDVEILYRRLDERVARDPTDFGGKPEVKGTRCTIASNQRRHSEKRNHYRRDRAA